MDKLISVVLPVYNGADIVGTSIESVLNQTYKNIELIIVNDCSTDNTLEVIKKYANKDNRIKIINNDVNLKLPSSLNEGFKNATGEYFTWTSDDNKYHKDTLYKLAKVLDENPDIQLVYSKCSIYDLKGNRISDFYNAEPDEMKFFNIIGASFLYRKELAKRVGEYDPDMFLAEDYDFFLRCYITSNEKFYYLNEDLYDYCMHEHNLTSTRAKEIPHKAFEVKMKYLDILFSKCKSKKEKIRFFDTLLYPLDYEEKVQVRKKFYSMDKQYMVYDIVRRIKNKIKRTFGIKDRISE